jgi:hypothetical protein
MRPEFDCTSPDDRDLPPILAGVRYDKDTPIDRLLAVVRETLEADGFRLAGVLQEIAIPGSVCATTQGIDIVEFEHGERFPIWDRGGACAEGCRLDERGLIAAAPRLERRIEQGADLLLINRFGRAEARGGGLLSVLAKAIEAGIPVLTAVRRPYDRAWAEFHGGLADDLPPSQAAVTAWCRRAIRCRGSATPDPADGRISVA